MRKSMQYLLPAMLLLAGCSSIQVSQDYQSTQLLHGLNSYAWSEAQQEKTGDIRIDTPLIDARIRTAIDETLASRGYRKVAPDRADILVAYRYLIRDRLRSDPVQTSVGFGFGNFGHYGAFGVGTGYDVSSYDEALLVIDFLDPGDGSTLWRGKGTRPVFIHTEPERMTEQINRTVHKILDQFPP